MRILILGAGAIGGYYGMQLAEAGADVSFLVRPRRAAQLVRDGLQVESRGRWLHRAVPTLLAGQVAAPFDLVLLTCKAYDLGEAVEAIAPAMGSASLVLPLLNGMAQYDLLDARFGAGRVLGFVPAEQVPKEVLRVDVHARLGRLLRQGDLAGVEALEDELEDRFGEAQPPLRNLFALARLAAHCRRLGVLRLEVGPAAAAATLRQAPETVPPPLEHKGDRLLLRQESPDPEARLEAAEALLAALRPGRRRAA